MTSIETAKARQIGTLLKAQGWRMRSGRPTYAHTAYCALPPEGRALAEAELERLNAALPVRRPK